jgi:pimeloyl-ACP methyl ester carboxylesterase
LPAIALLPPVDRAIVTQPAVQAVIREDIASAFQQGFRGPAADLGILARPWAFSPAAIRVPVQLWHGEQDKTVPVRMGRELAARIPACQARFLPAAGHFFIFERWREILAALLT